MTCITAQQNVNMTERLLPVMLGHRAEHRHVEIQTQETYRAELC